MNPIRRHLVILGCLAAAAAGMLSCNLVAGVRGLGNRQPAGTATIAAAVEAAGAVRYLTTKELREDSPGNPEYTISMVYPYLHTGAENGFNKKVKSVVDEIYQQFKASLEQSPMAEDVPLSVNLNSLSMDYRLYYSSDDLISVYFTFSEYHAGAAHPNPFSAVVNYSLTRDEVIDLDYIFLPDVDYLRVMSDYCISQLQSNEAFLFEDGATPAADNFRNWNIVPEGILVTFDPYQVAPYAAGFIKVVVPFSVLQPYLAGDSFPFLLSQK